MKNTLWGNSPPLSVNLSSGSFWFHLPPAQNGLAGRGQICRVSSAPSPAALASRLHTCPRSLCLRAFSTSSSSRVMGHAPEAWLIMSRQESAAGTSSPGIAATASEILGYWKRSAAVGEAVSKSALLTRKLSLKKPGPGRVRPRGSSFELSRLREAISWRRLQSKPATSQY